MEVVRMEIGNVIKEYRKLKDMTQEDLAAALLVTPQAVSRWETGISYPDIAMVPEIVKVLGVSADELLGCGSQKVGEDRMLSPAPDSLKSAAPAQEAAEKILNQNQIDSIFNYVPHPDPVSKVVLVIDDSDFMRMMLTDILSHAHHKVLQAGGGEAGLPILEGKTCGVRVDVCILDIHMPGMDGLTVLKAIKKDYPDVKVVMLSALCTKKNVEKALALGADSFVAKPFQPSTLLERI